HSRLSRCFNKFVGLAGADVDGLFRENMQTLFCSGDALGGVQARRAANHDQVHGAVRQKSRELSIGRATVLAAEPLYFSSIRSVNCANFDARDSARSARVRFRDVAAANQSQVKSHPNECIKALSDTERQRLCRRPRWFLAWQFRRKSGYGSGT